MITGANNDIGLAIAQGLLEERDCVAVLDLTLENLDQAKPNRNPTLCLVPQELMTLNVGFIVWHSRLARV
jgi:NAD(P)-dependent dehydrogenase (short-subunit alcohol dehydrogenase family)